MFSRPQGSRFARHPPGRPHSGFFAARGRRSIARVPAEKAAEHRKGGGFMSSAVEPGIDVRPFQVEIPNAAVDDLRRRIAETRWPSKELVGDRSQGVQLATIQELARYWTADYDFGRVGQRLNALPQFVTEID